MAKSFPADAVKTNLDAGTADPKQARVDLADHVDKFNTLKGALQPIAAMAVGSGLTVTDNGVGNPDTLSVTPVSSFGTGDVKLTLKTVPDAGWVMADDGTIGNAASGATNRANADAEALFTLIWNNISNTYAPVSGGARGASAAADFAASRTIKLGSFLGRTLAVAGAGAGLTSRAMGQFLGEEAHALIPAENGPHDHLAGELVGGGVPDHPHTYPKIIGEGNTWGVSQGAVAGGSENSSNAGGHTPTIMGDTGPSGSGTPHNTMQPTVFLKAMIKL